MCSGCKSRRKERLTTNFHREPCAVHREVWGEASVAACAGRAIEPRNNPYWVCRDTPSYRRQHFLAAIGEAKEGPPGSKNHGTYRSTSSGPGRSSNRPVVVRGRRGKKGKTEANDERFEEVRFGHSSYEAGEQRAATSSGVRGAKGRSREEFGQP